jgi:hypothetical protein
MEKTIYITVNEKTGAVDRIDDFKIEAESGFIVIEQQADIQSDDIFEYFNKKYVNGNFVEDTELIEQNNQNVLRDKRYSLLQAFDRYKTNLIIKAIEVSNEEQSQIIEWYHLILDLDENSINNPPEKIKYYIE